MKKEIKEKYIRGFLFLYVVILFLINFFRSFDNCFWADECYSIGLVKMGFIDMIRETGADVHPPLYYMILKLICFIFGQKGWVFHFVSVLPMGLTVLFCATKVYRKFGFCVSSLLATFVFLWIMQFYLV